MHLQQQQQQQQSTHSYKLPITNTKTVITPNDHDPSPIQLAQLNSSNTPPVKLIPSAPKFVQNMTQQTVLPPAPTQPPQIPPMLPLNLPLTTNTQAPTLPSNPIAPNVPNPPMSVTYAFMKNTQSTKAPTPPNPPTFPMSTSQPKFLMSSTYQNYQPTPPAPLVVKQSKSPQTQPAQISFNNMLDDMPHKYTLEGRINSSRANKASPSGPSSPQESICSRMSDSSIPSVIKQDTAMAKAKLQSLLNAANTTSANNACSQPSDFKALFSKLNTSKSQQPLVAEFKFNKSQNNKPLVEQMQQSFGYKHGEEDEEEDEDNLDEEPKKFVTEERDESILSNYNPAYLAIIPNTSYKFNMFSPKPAQYAVNKQNVGAVVVQSNYEEENEENDNELNITTKPMNTPAGFGCVSGASMIDANTSNEDTTTDVDESVFEKKPSAQQDESFSSSSNKLALDDLESFISEFYAEASPEVKKQEVVVNKSKLTKRSSLQSLDSINSTKTSSLKSQVSHKRLSITDDQHLVVKSTKPAVASVTTTAKTKRLSTEKPQGATIVASSYISGSDRTVSKARTTQIGKPASVITSKVVSKPSSASQNSGPQINSTRSSQLRASNSTNLGNLDWNCFFFLKYLADGKFKIIEIHEKKIERSCFGAGAIFLYFIKF